MIGVEDDQTTVRRRSDKAPDDWCGRRSDEARALLKPPTARVLWKGLEAPKNNIYIYIYNILKLYFV